LFLKELHTQNLFDKTARVIIELYGSLSLTGKGHATDLAVMLGLSGADPEYVPVESIDTIIQTIQEKNQLVLDDKKAIPFSVVNDFVYNNTFLPTNAYVLVFKVILSDKMEYTATFYSIEGGFVIKERQAHLHEESDINQVPFAVNTADELLKSALSANKKISEIVTENEKVFRSEGEISKELLRI